MHFNNYVYLLIIVIINIIIIIVLYVIIKYNNNNLKNIKINTIQCLISIYFNLPLSDFYIFYLYDWRYYITERYIV